MKKRLLKFVLIGLIAVVLFAFAFNGYPTVTDEDRTYINRFLQEWKIPANKDSIHASFESEVAFISRVQDSVVAVIQNDSLHDTRPHDRVGNLKFYFDQRLGSCYDRSMFLEKIFCEYGFPIRHMYLFFNGDSTRIKPLDFFKKGLTSHAMMEVKTVNGWMVVGTNGNWLGLSEKNQPLTIGQARADLKNGNFKYQKKTTIGITFFEILKMPHNFKILYGVYSRHGEFLYSPIENACNRIGIPSFIPDYNLRMLLYNF